MTGPDPFALDPAAVRRAFDRASATYDAAAVVAARAREELLGRLALLAFEPDVVADLGAGTGHGARALRRRFRRARVLALDTSPRMLARAKAQSVWRARFDRVRADARQLPLADGSVDLVFSNLMLPWIDDVPAVFREVRRVLRPRGYFTFSTLGPDTLQELREAFASVDGAAHVHRFGDLRDVGDALGRCGFADPVVDVDRLRLTYGNLSALHRDLKAQGAQNALAARPRGLARRGPAARVAAAYERFRDADGRLPATCEVVYGAAWCPGTTPPVRSRRGETVIPLESLRRRGA